MAKRKFDDPLDSIDPIMEQAYSVGEDELEEDDSAFVEAAPAVAQAPAAAPTPAPAPVVPAPAPAPIAQEAPVATPAPVAEPAYDFPDMGGDISEIQFPDLIEDNSNRKVETDVFSNIPIKVSVELGRSQISLKEVFELTEGSIIELERLVGEPLDLVVNSQVIAQGEVVAIDNNYGLRITNIVAHLQK